MDRCNAVIESNKPYHITCVVGGLLPLFSQPGIVDIILERWRNLRKREGLQLFAYVVMEEHLHFVAQAERLDSCLSDFVGDTEKQILEYLHEQRLERFLLRLNRGAAGATATGRIWQDVFEVELLPDNDSVLKTLDYVHINPVKRGYVDLAEDWRYSSARNYAGKLGLLEIDYFV